MSGIYAPLKTFGSAFEELNKGVLKQTVSTLYLLGSILLQNNTQKDMKIQQASSDSTLAGIVVKAHPHS